MLVALIKLIVMSHMFILFLLCVQVTKKEEPIEFIYVLRVIRIGALCSSMLAMHTYLFQGTSMFLPRYILSSLESVLSWVYH